MRPRHPVVRAIVTGGAIAGTLDITYATVFSAYHGVPPLRILQSVASGLIGAAAYSGGLATGVLGLALHFVIAFLLAAIFCGLSRRVPALLRHAAWAGIVYGAAAYAVMNLVVIPLSAFPGHLRYTPAVVVTGLLVHLFLIGLPIALAARRHLAPAADSPS
jgi:hypothetical protein